MRKSPPPRKNTLRNSCAKLQKNFPKPPASSKPASRLVLRKTPQKRNREASSPALFFAVACFRAASDGLRGPASRGEPAACGLAARSHAGRDGGKRETRYFRSCVSRICPSAPEPFENTACARAGRLHRRGQRFLVRQSLPRAARLQRRNLRHVQTDRRAPHAAV